MYAGKIRESGSADEIYVTPRHPYTAGLLDSVPRLDRPKGTRLQSIEGEIPDLTNLPTGCAYHPRCPFVVDKCTVDDPQLEKVGETQATSCWEWQRLVDREGQVLAK